MQKVTFKYDLTNGYQAPRNYTMEFDMSEMTLEEVLNEMKRFLLLVGYAPESVQQAFPEL